MYTLGALLYLRQVASPGNQVASSEFKIYLGFFRPQDSFGKKTGKTAKAMCGKVFLLTSVLVLGDRKIAIAIIHTIKK